MDILIQKHYSKAIIAYVTIGILFSSFFSAPEWGTEKTGSVQLISAIVKGSAIALPFIIILITNIYRKQRFNKIQFEAVAWAIFPLLLIGTYGLFTCLWSPFPTLSVIRSVSLIVALSSCVMVSTIFIKLPIKDSLFFVRDIVFIIAGISVTIIVCAGLMHLNGFWRYDGRLGGQIIPTNTLGALSGIVVGMAFIRLLAKERIWISLLLAVPSFLSLYWCFSRAAFLSLTFSMILTWSWEKFKYPKNLRQSYLNLSFLLFSCGVIAFVFSEHSDYLFRFLLRGENNIEDLQTASSRSLLWAKMLHNPGFWLIPGYGYSAVSETGFINLGAFATNHAHNGFLQILLGTGILGIFSLIWFFLRLFSIINMHAIIPSIHWRLIVFSTSFFLINNLSEASIGYQIYPQLIILVLIISPVSAYIPVKKTLI